MDVRGCAPEVSCRRDSEIGYDPIMIKNTDFELLLATN